MLRSYGVSLVRHCCCYSEPLTTLLPPHMLYTNNVNICMYYFVCRTISLFLVQIKKKKNITIRGIGPFSSGIIVVTVCFPSPVSVRNSLLLPTICSYADRKLYENHTRGIKCWYRCWVHSSVRPQHAVPIPTCMYQAYPPTASHVILLCKVGSPD